jgi:hypothetical protein
MMKKISSKSDFQLYREFVKAVGRDTFGMDRIQIIKSELEQLPNYMQEIIKDNKGLFPNNVTTGTNKELLIDSLIKLNPDYKLDENSEAIINSMAQYFSGDQEFLKDDSFSFKKGLLIMGGVGCGKTLLFRGINEMLKLFNHKVDCSYGLKIFNMTISNSFMFSEDFSRYGYEMFDQFEISSSLTTIKFMDEPIIIDDIGAESIANHFGNSLNIVGEIILRRYEGKSQTFGTTNLDRPHLKSFYGDRVFSRMIEMFNFLVYKGGDRRH